MMFGPRIRLLLCAGFKLGLGNFVYMGMGWLPGGWWKKTGTACQPSEIQSMAKYFIGTNMMFWRDDLNTKLSCAKSMTAGEFKTEWFTRQGNAVGDMSNNPQGYFLSAEGACSADAVCMFAQALHTMLITKSFTLSDLTRRTPA